MRNMEPPEKYKMAVKVPQNGRWAEVYIPQMVQVFFPRYDTRGTSFLP